MIVTLFIIPLIILISGFFMYKYPAKRINFFVGYRTRKSMKNEKNWQILNKHCGKVWVKLSLILLAITLLIISLVLFKIINLTEIFLIIIILFQVLILIITSCFIEMTYND